jgi:transposase-like protein
MKKEEKLVNKVKRLLRRLGCSRWLHHYGPKTYEFLDHFIALLIRFFCRLAYRRVKKLLDLLGIKCPTKSSLQRTAKKLDSAFWQKVLKATSGNAYLIAIDSTGLSRTNPSYHYLKRIDGKMPKVPVKVSVAFDTRKKKFCAAKIRVLPAHDIKDAKILLKQSKPKVFVADKAYDANWLHKYCNENGIKAHIPIRTGYGKSRHQRLSARRQATKYFRIRTYHRRELVESGNSSIKRKYGSSVNSKTVRTIRTEVYGRLACHNIFFWIQRLSGQSRMTAGLVIRKLFKWLIIP